MVLVKQPININFASGLNTKTDPWQVPIGQFLGLENTVFNKGGLLAKRNGYQNLTTLPTGSNASYLTTLNNNLTAIGNNIIAYNEGNASWVSKGTLQPMQVSTLPLIRNNLNQTQCDAVIASNGLVCTVYSELNNSTTTYKYAIADSTTGQNIVAPTVIPVSSGTVTNSPRVFLLNQYFIIAFTNVISSVDHLQYIAISSLNPTSATVNADLVSAHTPSTTLSWDGAIVNNTLCVAFNSTVGGQSIKAVILNSSLVTSAPITLSNGTATLMSVCVDNSSPSNPIVYISYYNSVSSTGYTIVTNRNLAVITAATEIISSGTVLNLTSAAQNGVCTIFEEISHNYSYDSSIPSHYIEAVTITQAGSVGTPYVSIRSVGLASKAFIINEVIYYLSAYQSSYQPSYFLINGSTSTSAAPVIVGKLAYENGGGYLPIGLPSITVQDTTASMAYLYKDLIEPLNTLNNSQQTTSGGIYSQTGINLGNFDITTDGIDTAEIGNDLHISGGFLSMYDGYLPVEHNFFLWPDSIEVTTATSGGLLEDQQYYYQVIYEWSDNQGNIFRSAPSIPVTVTTSGGGTSANTIYIPTLRLTMKTANPVKITIYRWSATNETYYQITSLTAPTLNSTTTDSITYVDTLADTSIIGNEIIYTDGGVIEDVNAPATNIMTLFDTRLWMVDAEDQNLLWYSKQVIESTPVEMSDLLTFYVAPNTGTVGSTGPITALAPMDDKLIIFKANAIYYINGTGPDNTGANNQYSQPIFITSTVGCANQQSIVFTTNGLIFQSDKGLWLLGRDLSTVYIGAAVEAFNAAIVSSALNIPETNQVRFTLSTGLTLMYDYFYNQWGTFVGVPAISACIYNGLHTSINYFGVVFQENPGYYVDGSNPVLMSFTTSWLQLAGIQGYQRAHFFYILGQYLSPHKLNMQIAYDYASNPSQSILIAPTNFTPTYGTSSPYGQGSYGGNTQLERWRVFLDRQRCQSIQISMQEEYDPTFGVPAGAGLTLSGLQVIASVKSRFRPTSAQNSTGGNN